MKMVAAAKLRRAQDRITAARPYAESLSRVLASLASRTEHTHPLLEQRENASRSWLVVVTSDKGMCGSFNANLLRYAERELKAGRFGEVEIVAIGRKASDFFRRREWTIAHEERELMSSFTPNDGKRLSKMFMQAFSTEQVDSVWILCNRFVNLIRHETVIDRLLPIEASELETGGDDQEPPVDYIYEPDAQNLLSALLPRQVEVQVQRALYDSAASEQAARMTAMDSATKNASEMIDALTLLYNRTRQAAITKELIEIVSGAQALGE
jgi:F-type H+-transporting ATPase subunit gamma